MGLLRSETLSYTPSHGLLDNTRDHASQNVWLRHEESNNLSVTPAQIQWLGGKSVKQNDATSGGADDRECQ